MSDPSPANAGAHSADADRDARIEQLLVAGLDQYFAGEYQQAINIWTRVVFLERGHGRARAYIERARSALAERQRECDELVQHGVDAYNAGDTAAARDLLTRAVEQGGRSDTAELFLDRLSRVSTPGPLAAPPDAAPRLTLEPSAVRPRRAGGRWMPTVFASVGVVLAVLVASMSLAGWLAEPDAVPAARPEPLTVEPLPIVRPSEVAIVRARDLYQGGHLRDALRLLERVDSADPLRADADRLVADVQRELLALAVPPVAAGGAR